MLQTKAALLVAAAVYDDPKFQRLRAPAHDVEALTRVLESPEIGGYEVQALVNETHWVVARRIEEFYADRKRDDMLLLYLSCHGVKDAAGRLHFAASNTEHHRLASTGISATFINDQLDHSLSRRILVLLDCCYSGAFARGFTPRSSESVHVQQRFEGRGRAIITASDAMEYAYEGDELALDEGQPSVFTSALVEGLETGEADRDGDGWVAVDELYEYLFDGCATPRRTRRRPCRPTR